MVYSTNKACSELGPWVVDTCVEGVEVCQIVTGQINDALTPIALSLFALGGLCFIDGTIKITDKGINLISRCYGKCINGTDTDEADALILNSLDQYCIEKIKPDSRWRKLVKIWDSAFPVFKQLGVASLCLSIGVPVYRLNRYLISNCRKLDIQCPEAGYDATSGCDWVSEWLIETIKGIFTQKMLTA